MLILFISQDNKSNNSSRSTNKTKLHSMVLISLNCHSNEIDSMMFHMAMKQHIWHSIQVIVLLLLCKFHVNFLFLTSLKMDLTKCNVQALIKLFYILKLWSFKLKFWSIAWNSHKSPSEVPSSNFIWPLPAESSCWPKVLQWGKCLHWWWWWWRWWSSAKHCRPY